MRKHFMLLLIAALMFGAMPGFAQDLTAPQVTSLMAVDHSGSVLYLGYCLLVEWDAVAGAERYAIRVIGTKGAASYQYNWPLQLALCG